MGIPALLLHLAPLLALVNTSPLQMQRQKRGANDLGQVYAYGGGLSGVPIFVKDSTAYVGNLSETGTSGTYVSCKSNSALLAILGTDGRYSHPR